MQVKNRGWGVDAIKISAVLFFMRTGAVIANPSDNGSYVEGALATSYHNAAYRMLPHITYQNALSKHWNLQLRAFLKKVDIMALLGYSMRINPNVMVTPRVGLSYELLHAAQLPEKRYVSPNFSLQTDVALSEAWFFITEFRYAQGVPRKKGYEWTLKLHYALLDGIGVHIGYRGRKMGSLVHHCAEVGMRMYM